MKQNEPNYKNITPNEGAYPANVLGIDKLIPMSSSNSAVQPDQDKEGTSVKYNLSYLFFPTYENTVQHLDDLKREYPEFMEKASHSLKKIDNMSLAEIEKGLNLTEEERSIWRDLISTLVHYYDFNNIEDSTKKK